MATVRPFIFTGLRHYSGEQVAIQESVAACLSYRPFAPDFAPSLAAVLESHLGVQCRFGQAEMRPVSSAELHRLLPVPACIVVIGAAPAERKILCELDVGLAFFAIDRLLGGSGETSRVRRALTEVEEGVLSFLILKALSHFQAAWHTGAELALTLDRLASRSGEIRDTVDAECLYHSIGVRLAAGSCTGYVRILVPAGLVTRVFSSPLDQGAAGERELARVRRLLAAIGDTRVEACIEAASLDLGPNEIESLEVGDVVILESHAITKGPNGIEGTVSVRIGTGQNGGLRGRVTAHEEHSRLEILDIVVQEQPTEANMDELDNGSRAGPEAAADHDTGAAVEEDNLAETQGLLRDVPARVVVELGRIRLNTAQVVRLRSGQILRLPRGPNDPVDLVVNGKLFARGELVEVDGELGIRLLHVAGDG